MFLKAILICEDVRVEANGTVTLVGVFNERLLAAPGDGPIRVQRLAFVATVGGLAGVEKVMFRHRIRNMRDADAVTAPYTSEPHDPEHDEHNFVLRDATVFPRAGAYEFVIDVAALDDKQTFRYRFTIERAKP